jgi:hypothetical protein
MAGWCFQEPTNTGITASWAMNLILRGWTSAVGRQMVINWRDLCGHPSKLVDWRMQPRTIGTGVARPRSLCLQHGRSSSEPVPRAASRSLFSWGLFLPSLASMLGCASPFSAQTEKPLDVAADNGGKEACHVGTPLGDQLLVY